VRPVTPSSLAPRWTSVADFFIIVLFVASVLVLLTDGGLLWIGDVRLSVRSPGRPLFLGIILAAIRFWRSREKSALVAYLLQRELGLITLGCSLAMVIATWPQAVQPYAVSDLGDPLFSIWRLMWLSTEFPRNPLNVFNANQFHPEPRTLTFSDPTLTPSILFGLLTGLGLHRIVAYNIVLLSGGVLSGIAMYYLVRALTGRADAAWISAALFTVHPYRLEHYSHLELQMTMWMPIALWFLHRTLASGRLIDGLVTGAAFIAQMLSALYYGAFLVPMLIVVGACLWFARGMPLKPLGPLAAGAVLAGILFMPVAIPYLQTRDYMGNRTVHEASTYSGVGSDYFKAHYRSWTYGGLTEGAKPERSLFQRLTPTVLAAVSLWPPLSATRIAYALALAFSVEASFGFNGSIFPALYEHVPPFGGIRVPARFGVAAGMCLAILAGFGAVRILDLLGRARPAGLAAILGLVCIEALPDLELVRPWRQPPPIYASLAGRPPSVLAEFPMPETGGDASVEFAYLYFSTFHWQKLVNGQSGWLPPTYLDLLNSQRDFPSDSAIAVLRRRGVEYIGVHGHFYGRERFASVVAALDGRRDVQLVSRSPWGSSESRLYRLLP
jgi:hypothetical protein